ncbi:hypothetical protein [Aquisphaera insulae]|uniref:hypothetical protein n=1 Tax=Aquisphaera insulae TaxID=2712864 RepID=UPI0013EA5D96|nr:hypothetical protein [Aquisphaera insulae]
MSSLLFVTRTFAVLAVGFSSLCALTATGVIMPSGTTTQVTGKLTFSGRPVQQATIVFTPKGTQSAEYWGAGMTDADGNFEVSMGGSESGLKAGAYTVRLLPETSTPSDREDAPTQFRRRIPTRFYDDKTSEIGVEIAPGAALHLEIELPEGPGA